MSEEQLIALMTMIHHTHRGDPVPVAMKKALAVRQFVLERFKEAAQPDEPQSDGT